MKRSWKMRLGIGGGILVAAVIAFLVWGKTWRMMLANRNFRSGRLGQAGAVYQEMAVDQPKSPYILHNQSLVAYETARTGATAPASTVASLVASLTAANQLMAKALQETDKMKNMTAADRNKLFYHAGNAAFQAAAALEAGGAAALPTNAVTAAGNKYQEALQDFKRAIVADPGDPAAKYNYELTQLRLEQNRQNQQQQQPRDNDGKDPKKQAQGTNSGDPKQNNSGKKNRTENRQGSQNKGEQPRPDGGMTKGEAEALLKMAENGDQYRTPQAPEAAGTPEKDW